ncbi:hypothetical protein GCM10009087_21400 [Sphingomonas oligophenolica]|uniref:DUF1440 domain-containing protein n=1 Tax=Sphingomonas oligophenolica TaxID=301154 RepID=A0ABU9Y3T3_9SPHN
MVSQYSGKAIVRATIIATVIAGTLDILSAFAFDIMANGTPLGVLRGVGSAIVDREAFANPLVLPAIGLGLHFAIMLVMAAVYMLAASRVSMINRLPVLSGIGYGVMLWGIMYWVVLPYRWPTLFPIDPRADMKEVGEQLFSHVVLVGIPIALVAKAATRWRFTSDY